MPRVAINKALVPPSAARSEASASREPEASPPGRYAMDDIDAKVDKALAEGKRIKGIPSTGRWILPLGNKGHVLLAVGTDMTGQGQRLKDLGHWSGPWQNRFRSVPLLHTPLR